MAALGGSTLGADAVGSFLSHAALSAASDSSAARFNIRISVLTFIS
jgi:hypothetical protein